VARTSADDGRREAASSDETLDPGRRHTDRSFQGVFLDTALWTIRGTPPGPTLCIVSGVHGDEINSIEIARRSFHLVDPQHLKGTLIVVPAANRAGRAGVVIGAALPQVVLSGYGVFHIGKIE